MIIDWNEKNYIKWDNKNWRSLENGDFLFDLKNITEKTFDITAQKWSLVIANADRGVEKNQLRNFYDMVLKLYEKAQNANNDEFKKKVLPFIKMLNSKVAYAKTRGVCGDNFEILMKESINKVSTPEELQNFKYFLESIIGFMPKK